MSGTPFSLPLLLLGTAAGGAIGALYFRWLWWAVQALAGRGRSGLWFTLHLLGRHAFALAGFALVAQGLGWPALAAALAGFVFARTLLQRRLGVADEEAARHAPRAAGGADGDKRTGPP